MELDYDATPGKYVDYCIATQASWKIWLVDNRERFKQIFDALKTSKRVKKLLLRCNLLGGLQDNDLYQLASAIEANTSLEILILRGLSNDVSLGFAAVLRALADHQPKLTKFSCTTHIMFVPIEWTAFIEFLRSNTQLKELEFFNNGLTEEQIIELMDVLQYNTELKSLDLQDNDISVPSLMAIARFAAKSTTIEDLMLDEENLTPDLAAELISIMQDNKSLISVNPSNGFINKSDFVARNLKAFQAALEERRKFEYPKEPEPWQPVLLPDTTHEPSIKQLSSEILQIILWQLDIKSLCAFRRADKKYHTFTKNNNFWRNYYTTYFSCIPGDVFLLTDLTYGLKLANAQTHVEAFATPVWEEIFINSFRARNVSAGNYPTSYCIPFMEPVYRQFPQLIGTQESEGAYTALPPDSNILKMKGLPYNFTWFLLFAKGSALYHLGFEKLNDGQYNGILFFTQDYSEAFSARFDYMLYIFEWFATNSETEFAEKCKHLCQIFLSAQETNNHHYLAAPFYKKIDQLVLEPALKSRDRLVSALDTLMDTAAKDFCRCQNVNMTVVEDLAKKFIEFSEIPDLELERVRQYIPKRSTLNSKYVLNDNVNYHNFTSHDWGIPGDETIKYKAPKHRKKSKKLPQIALMKLYRVTLNLILMPLLKTFWLADINDPDYPQYPFLRGKQSSSSLFKELYYSSSYVPFKHVSISKAHPSQWPMIALGLANQIMPYIIAAINGMINGTKDDLDKLLSVLDYASVLVPQQIKLFLKKCGHELLPKPL